VTAPGQLARPQRTLRGFGLLCALLLGLLGMHGLGPVPGHAHHSSAPARMTASVHTDVTVSMPGECDHGAGGCTGHVAHADPTCASASIAGARASVPDLLPDVVACVERADARTSMLGSGPDGGRGPPSLSELQLLRI
jgi:hypothetical protein